jgi:Ca-activated chloride channel family protein
LIVAAQDGRAGAQVPGILITVDGSVVDRELKPLPGVSVTLERSGGTAVKQVTDSSGAFRFEKVVPGEYRVRAELAGFTTVDRQVTIRATPATVRLPLVMHVAGMAESAVVQDQARTATTAPLPANQASGGVAAGGGGGRGGRADTVTQVQAGSGHAGGRPEIIISPPPYYGGESYSYINAGRFQRTLDQPVSTFGADVDTASYSNVRRFLASGQLPPRDAVRVEELINYFRFNYPDPRGNRPISLTTEVGDCPWAPSHKLVLVGARARSGADRDVGTRNIVLLIDVSGSMQPNDKLPLIKTALGMFVDTLRPDDRLGIVTYAGTSGVALPSTPARHRDVIHRAIDGLYASGSTNGGEGLMQAYRMARQGFVPGGVNRVILATDGDFNVGIVDQRELVRLIEREKDSGVFLSVFGVGTGNLKDSTMQMLADRGNGHYAYLDSLQEARRVLIREGESTLETVAKDVKFQVEFNPAAVLAWKLIGYENRALARQDFNNDRKDGGEMGAGHTVTVLYEIVPAGAGYPEEAIESERPLVDPLKYQMERPDRETPDRPVVRPAGVPSGELLTVKVRYQPPEGSVSDVIVQAVQAGSRGRDLPFVAAVAEFGLLLREGRASAERWDRLGRRLKTVAAHTSNAADHQSFTELVELAAGLAKLR